ncbi:MAG: hypothetical protein IJ455_06595 [Agathobacter sp.]|nr:hypothetical protein [Agathobacter sp.]
MALIKCPECGNQVSEMADKCMYCGFPIHKKVNRSIEKKKCSYCGTYSAIYEDICSSCGARFEETATEKNIDRDAFENLMDFDKMKNLMGFDEMEEFLDDTMEELMNMDIPETSSMTKKTVNIDIVDDTMNVTMQVESQDGKTSENITYQGSVDEQREEESERKAMENAQRRAELELKKQQFAEKIGKVDYLGIVKKIGVVIYNIIFWVLFSFMSLLSLGSFLSDRMLSAIIFLVTAILINPLFGTFIRSKSLKYPKWIAIIILLVGFIIGVINLP